MEAKTSKMINLNGTNYHIWRSKMKDLLFVTKMHLPVFGTTKPEGKTDEEWEFEHKQVCGFIQQFVEDMCIITFVMRLMHEHYGTS